MFARAKFERTLPTVDVHNTECSPLVDLSSVETSTKFPVLCLRVKEPAENKGRAQKQRLNWSKIGPIYQSPIRVCVRVNRINLSWNKPLEDETVLLETSHVLVLVLPYFL